MDHLAQNTYFFEQSLFRKTPKRYKKSPEELPYDLRYAHLNPRVAAHLASRDREKEQAFESGRKSLLPQINRTISLIRESLLTEEEASRYRFEDSKEHSLGLLDQLALVLYKFDLVKPSLPRVLENHLQSNHKELIQGTRYIPRDWQCAANREEYMLKHGYGSESSPDDRESLGLSVDSEDHGGRDRSPDTKSRSRSKMSRANTTILGDIVEDEEATSTSRSDGGGKAADQFLTTPHSSSRQSVSQNQRHPKTRLEKYKSGMRLDSRPGSAAAQRHLHPPHGGHHSARKPHETSSVLSHASEGTSRSMMATNNQGYWSVIQFQLSSKLCQDKGWVLHPSAMDDLERGTLLEWATQRLQAAMRKKKEQEAEEKRDHDCSVILRYYGDNRRDQLQRYTNRAGGAIRTSQLTNGQVPRVPPTSPRQEDKPLFQTTLADSSTTIFYPSGRLAIVSSRADGAKGGFYISVYDNNPARNMLAVFTPSGKGCCYHENGTPRFLCTPAGGTMAEEDGSIVKRWDWPTSGIQKLPVTIVVQLNQQVTFRCSSLHQMVLVFSCQREQAKVNVGQTVESAPSREEMGTMQLMRTFSFSSQAAKDFEKPSRKLHSSQKGKFKPSKGKLKTTSSSDIQKVLDLPEPTENDAEADKQLIKLQRKVKNLVEDWLDHYRIAVGISSPHLKKVKDIPERRQRDVTSAKSSPGGCRVIVESMATQVERPSISQRAPSAPTRRHHESPPPSRRSSPISHKVEPSPSAAAVTFDENVEEVAPSPEPSCISPVPIPSTPFEPSVRSGSACRTPSARLKSAPQRVSTVTPAEGWGPAVHQCPAALRMMMMAELNPTCRCSRHKVPYVTDLEYDEFIMRGTTPPGQLIIVSIISSLYPDAAKGQDMLEKLHSERNRNRTRPCLQCRCDPYRVVLYDVATAADDTDHCQPLLLRRHNVVPGMFLMYESGKLVSCDHIFNGYGNTRKDFQKQVFQSRRSASGGNYLPNDFHFSPQRGRQGARSAWGGQIGGAGVDSHGGAGLSMESGLVKRSSLTSLSSDNSSKDIPIDYRIGGPNSSAKFISLSMTAASNMLSHGEDWPRTRQRAAPAPAPKQPARRPAGLMVH